MNSFKKAEVNSNFNILIMVLDKDHIHLLLEFKPSTPITQVVKRLKQLTTKYIWDDNETYLKQFYWGSKKRLWSGGYFCSTIGQVSEQTIKQYIEKQG